MDIQTQDGILLKGIPDGTPDEAIKARIAAIRAEGQQPSRPTTEQKVQASAPMRFIQGMRDPIDAGAQILSHMVPESVTRVLDAPGRMLRNSDSPLLQTIGDRFFADPSAQATDQRLAESEQQYQAARQATAPKTLSSLVTGQRDPGADVMRFAGNIASPVNAAAARVLPIPAKATALRLAGTGAVAGGVGGLETPVTDPTEQANFGSTKAIQSGIGAVTGAALTPAIGKLVEALAPKVAAAVESRVRPDVQGARASVMTDQMISQALKDVGQDVGSLDSAYMQGLRDEVLKSLKAGRQLDVAALLRKQDFEKLGMQGTSGQITRDATQFARERNLRAVPNVGQPLLDTFTNQNQRIGQIVGSYGGPAAMESQQAGTVLAKALSEADESMRKQVSGAYTAARNAAGKDAEVPLQGLAQSYAGVLEDFGSKVPPEIRSKFAALGLDPANPSNQKKLLTVEGADRLLKDINDWVGADRQTNTALSRLRDALKSAVLEGGDDVFAGARNLAAQRFKLQDAVPALQAVAQGRASPDRFVQSYIVNGETADVKALATLLQKTNPQAFAEARNQLGATLERAAFGENAAGDKLIAPERFAKALRSIGTEKLSAFYSPQEIEQLQRVARVGAYINQTPNAAPVLGNPNFAWASNLINHIPGVPTAVRLAGALKTAANNASDVNAALAAKVPEQATQLSPEAARRLRQALMIGTVGAGMAVAPQ